MDLDIGPPLEIGLAGETHHRPGIAIGVIPEIVLLTIAQDDKRRFQRQGIRLGLFLGGVGIDGKTLGLKNCQRTTPRILQEVICAAVGGSFLRGDLGFVGDAPTSLLK